MGVVGKTFEFPSYAMGSMFAVNHTSLTPPPYADKMVKIGQKVPDFECLDHEGQMFKVC